MQNRCPELADSGVDLNPLLDVVFILLIFFIVTASYTREHAFPLTETRAARSTESRAGVVVTIDRDNQVLLQGKPVAIRALRARLAMLVAELGEIPTLNVHADGRADVGTYVAIAQAAQQVKIVNLPIEIRKFPL